MGYEYFDTPDGQDCDKKLVYMLKKAAYWGFGVSSAYVIVESPPTYAQVLGKFARVAIPILACTAAGTITVCLLTELRKKDERKNYFIGGLVGGVSGGLVNGYFGYGLFYGVFIGLAAFAVKNAQVNNFELILNKEPKQCIDDHWSKDHDWTLSRKIPPGWVPSK